ncbi:septation ring formation regulator EzrA [Limosilactobacillus fastidiosus]|uniref:septation ring formation regulator EzrA n=1 Tax=Limosilactobacillus fastidiosus TaxID=2759855 RepID=UPI001C718A29|nr:septation ring formation regulator EzrA [Limosilactobacillus fastidiosus]
MVFQIIIGILIVFAIVLASLFYYQKRVIRQYEQVNMQLERINDMKIGQQFEKVDQLSVTGDSQEQLKKLKREFQEKVDPQKKKLTDQLKAMKALIHTSKFLTLSSKLNDLSTAIQELSDQYLQIKSALHHLEELHRAHKQAIDQIKQRYRHFHHVLDEKSFEYGDSVKALNKRLNDLEQQYEQFTKLSQSGDYDAAQQVLTDLKKENQRLADLINQVPKLYKPLIAEFPTQLDELTSGYQQLTSQNYRFTTDNIPGKIDQLRQLCRENLEQINRLELDGVENANKDIADQIDDLYATMQSEIDAQPQVKHLMGVLGEFITHAAKQNTELTTELDRLSINYTLNNHEVETARSLNEQIINIKKEYEDDQEAIRDHTAIYSQVLVRQTKNDQSLTEIEKQQAKINDEVAKLQGDQQRAEQMLQKYSTRLRTTRRQVERLNLPGLPKDYLNYFFGVSDEIKRLADELRKYKVNMDEVTKQLIIVESDLETLGEKTSDIHDSVELTERLQQYANRFSDNQKIVAAAAKSQEEFNKFNYTASLETIATALEEVEPGSYKRIEDSYYHEKQ